MLKKKNDLQEERFNTLKHNIILRVQTLEKKAVPLEYLETV